MNEPAAFVPPEPNAALVVGPDDALVLSFPAGSLDLAEQDQLVGRFRDRFPDLADRVLFICGAQEIAVIRPPVSAALPPG